MSKTDHKETLDFLFNEKPTLTNKEQVKFLNELEEQVDGKEKTNEQLMEEMKKTVLTEVDVEEVDETALVTNEENVIAAMLNDLTNLEDEHPFEMLARLVKTHTKIVGRALTTFNSEDAEWARVQVSAMKEIRFLSEKIIPLWDAKQKDLEDSQEGWVAKQVQFVIWYINKNFGQTEVTKFMGEHDKFIDRVKRGKDKYLNQGLKTSTKV